MKLFLVGVYDHHDDPGYKLFRTPEAAVTYAKEIRRELFDADFDPELDEREDFNSDDDWLYLGDYSCEGDYITVRIVEVVDGDS